MGGIVSNFSLLIIFSVFVILFLIGNSKWAKQFLKKHPMNDSNQKRD